MDENGARHEAAKGPHIAERMNALVHDVLALAIRDPYFLPFTSGGALYAQDAPEERLTELREAWADSEAVAHARIDGFVAAIEEWENAGASDPGAWDLVRLRRAGTRQTLVAFAAHTLRLAYAIEEWSADGSRFLWIPSEDR